MSNTIYNLKTKKCTKCKEIKHINMFNKDRSTKDGLRYTCKYCDKQYHNNNKNILKKKRIEYCKNNKEHIRNKTKIYRKNNNKRLKENLKAYRQLHAIYKTFAHQLTIDEEPRLAADGISLQVRCKYCGKYFKPTNSEVNNRIQSINNTKPGEHSLYCSTNCKKSCGTYRRNTYPQGFKTDTSREVQPALRKLVLERDNWACQTCGATIDDAQLHCHHYEGIEINPIESADMDNCITLCKECHSKVHKDCDMRRNKC